MTRSTAQPWLSGGRAAWIAEVEAWVSSALARGGLGPLVALESVNERVWGAVLRVVTDRGPLYFKASGPLCRHEPPIIEALGPRWPRLVPDLLAVDRERAWMLLADHGRPMVALPPADQLEVLLGLLPDYAEMQRGTTDLVPTWMAAGMPDRRVHQLPRLLAELLDGRSPIGALSIEADERGALEGGADRFAEVCAELAGGPDAVALDHADMHGTNVFIDGASARLADWGDACATHPFSSLAVPYAFVVARLPGPEPRAATLRLRDTYLEAWGGPAEQREAFGLAVWVAHVTRAINVAHESAGTVADQGEVLDLLRTWHAKRTLLDSPDELIQPG